MKKDYNGYNYHSFSAKIYFSLIRVLKRQQKKVTLTSFYCLRQKAWLDDSWKPISINQSKFYNFFHVGKLKNG